MFCVFVHVSQRESLPSEQGDSKPKLLIMIIGVVRQSLKKDHNNSTHQWTF